MLQHATEPTAPLEPRAPADVLRAVVAGASLVALLLVKALFGDTLVGFAHDLLRGLDALPDRLLELAVVLTRVLLAAVLVAGLVVTAVRSGREMILRVAVSAVAAAGLSVGLGHIVEVDATEPVVDLGG